MPCSITIDEVRGRTDPGGAVTAVEVAGTAEGCVRIGLTLRCTDPRLGGDVEVSYRVEPTPGSPAWETTVSPPDCAACGRLLTVEAHCLLEGDVRHPDCDPAVVSEPLACDDCPRIRVERSIADVCAGGRRGVTYTVSVDAPAGVLVETRMDYGDGTSSGTTTERFYSRTRMYDPAVGPIHPRVEIVTPEGCPDAELPVFALEPCPEEEEPAPGGPRCPAVTHVTAGPVHAARDGCRLVWSANLTRRPLPGTYTWRFDGGSETVTTREPFITRTYADSGRHWVEVTYDPDHPECPISRTTGAAELEGCERGSGEGGGCIILRDVAMIGMALGTALLIVSTCLTDPNRANVARIAAAGFLVVALIVFALWLLFCAKKSCKPALLLSGLAVLGAGYALIHLASCCPGLVGLGPATAVAGGAILLGWRKACSMSWCVLFKEITIFTAGTLAMIIAALVLFLPPGCLPNFEANALAASMIAGFDLAFAGAAIAYGVCEGRYGDIGSREIPRVRDVEPPPLDD